MIDSDNIWENYEKQWIYGGLMGFIVIQWDINGIYPLVMTNIAIEAMAIEIVDVPIKNDDCP